MFRKMKLGTKIALGFGSLIVITVALGGLAVFNMSGVRAVAKGLAEENVPVVGVANNVERWSLSTMYEARGYNYTEEKSFLDAAKKSLEEVKKYLGEAKQHADKYDLADLRENAAKAEKAVLEYERLLNATVAATEAMAQEKAASFAAADHYMKVAVEFLADQTKRLDDEIDAALKTESGKDETAPSAITLDKVKERVAKITLCNDVIDLGNLIRLGTWQSIATRDPKLFQEAEKKFGEVGEKLDALKEITKQERHLKQIEECRDAGKECLGCMERFLTQWLTREELGKARLAAADQVLQAAKDTSEKGMTDTRDVSNEASASLRTACTIVLTALGFAVVIGVIIALFVTRSVTGPIKGIFKGLKTLSTEELKETGRTFRRIIDGLNEGAVQVNEAAGQVSGASQQLAEGASEQASSLEETSSALEQMAAMTRTNAGNAKEANNLAGHARTAANESDKTMGRLNEAMTGIDESSKQISKIIKVIEEIAFQTNLLALNAAVEAARAGEHGKGFAVVADEVRNLAQRAAQAARETTGLIEGSVVRVREGTQVAADVAKALGAIVGDVAKVSDLVDGITKASEEQAQGVDQVNTAVSQMDKVTQQNSAGAEESAAAAEELASQAQAVQSMVNELMVLVNGSDAGSASQGGTRMATATRSGSAKPKTHYNVKAAHLSKGPRSAGDTAVAKPSGGGSSPAPKPAEEFMRLDDNSVKES